MGFCMKLFLTSLYKRGFIKDKRDIEYFFETEEKYNMSSLHFSLLLKLDDTVIEQQKKIDQLKKENEKLREGLEFYANTASWVRGKSDGNMGILSKDRETIFYAYCKGVNFGGKKAREILKEVRDE